MEKRNIRDCDEFDSELLIRIYPILEKKCNLKDANIEKIACSYFSTSYGVNEVYDQLLNEMEAKNQMINLKLIIDDVISKLKSKSLKWALAMIDYRGLTRNEMGMLFDDRERTIFRRIETLHLTMAYIINNEDYKDRIINFIDSQSWTLNILEDIKERRLTFRKNTKEEQE